MTSLTTLPAQLNVIINGQPITIDTKDILGDGGEGIVFKVKVSGRVLAGKIIHPSMRSAVRVRKLEAQIQRRPPMTHRAIAPLHLIQDASTALVIGMCMEMVNPDSYDDLVWWMKDEFRKTNKIDFQDVCWIFLEIREELEALHKAGYIIGDFNPGGIKVMKKHLWADANQMQRIKFLDADCVEFDSHCCPVFSIAYLDYKLAPHIKDIGAKRTFSEWSDYFAFDAMFYQALTTANVYDDGWHDRYDAPKMRLIHGLTVLHPEVEYPDEAVPIDQLPTGFQKHFQDSFLKGERRLFPLDVLQQALGLQVQLSARPFAPTTQHLKVNVYQKLLQSPGDILDFYVSGGVITLLVSEVNLYVYTYFEGITRQVGTLTRNPKSIYQLMDSEHVLETQVSNRPQTTVTIYHVPSGIRSEPMTLVGAKGMPIAGGGNGHFYSASGFYLYGAPVEKPAIGAALHTVSPNAALLCDPLTGNAVVWSRIGAHYSWFFVRNDHAYDAQITPLDDTETMEDIAAIWGSSTVLVVRLTEYKGAKRTRLDEVTLSSSWDREERLLFNRVMDGEVFRPLNGIAYAHQNGMASILYATQAGIIRESLNTGANQVFASTKGLVRKGDSLRFYRDGLIAVNNAGQIHYLSL